MDAEPCDTWTRRRVGLLAAGLAVALGGSTVPELIAKRKHKKHKKNKKNKNTGDPLTAITCAGPRTGNVSGPRRVAQNFVANGTGTIGTASVDLSSVLAGTTSASRFARLTQTASTTTPSSAPRCCSTCRPRRRRRYSR